jgi:asparagine synthase (glutamine-hydrolysing)
MLTLPAGLQGAARNASGKGLVPEGVRGEWFKDQGVTIASATDMACGLNLKQRLRHDIFNFGLQNLLAWADQTAMQHSIECRLPYLNPRLGELVMSLPEEFLVARDGTCKQVLRTAVKGLVPDEILSVRRKVGFQTDTDRLLADSSHWVKGVVESESFRALPFVDLAAVRRQAESLDQANSAQSERLWRLVNFSLWAEERNLDY